jgi:hypothetical protein
MEATTMLCVLFLSKLLLLAAGQSSFAASPSSGGGGFSVELIHRDSFRSPFRDQALSPHARMLAAARRSLASDTSGGVVAKVVSESFEYLMSVSLGTPPREMLAIADTGSDLVWVDCPGTHVSGLPDPIEGGFPDPDDDGSLPPSNKTVFDPSKSSTYGVVRCGSDACRPLPHASCDANSRCKYEYHYGDGSVTGGVLSTETFTFRADGGGATQVPKVRFGCSSYSAGSPGLNGIVGLGGGAVSLVAQLCSAIPSIGRRFSYCLVPYANGNASSSVLNFGAGAVVSEPGAASTPLVPSVDPAYYTVELHSVSVGGQTVATKSSHMLVDSGTTLTILDPTLLGPLVKELERRVKLTRTPSPDDQLDLCYDVHGKEDAADWDITDVLLQFRGAAVTLKAMNTFSLVQEGTLCLMVIALSDQQSVSILGNLVQQDFHVGYDLDKGTVTFAPAHCAASKVSSY